MDQEAIRIEQEEKLGRAMALLRKLDSYLDFGEPVGEGGAIEFEDTSGINEAFEEAHIFLREST